MSILTDTLTALKNIVLLQERLDGVQRDVVKLSTDLGGIDAYVRDIDKRVVRIETLIEVAQAGQPRLER